MRTTLIVGLELARHGALALRQDAAWTPVRVQHPNYGAAGARETGLPSERLTDPKEFFARTVESAVKDPRPAVPAEVVFTELDGSLLRPPGPPGIVPSRVQAPIPLRGSDDPADGLARFARGRGPLLAPAMLLAMLFRYIIAVWLFSEVWLLSGGGPARSTEVLAVYLYLDAFRFGAFGLAAATGWLIVLFSLLSALFYLALLRRQMLL